ncbi:hypothetical protein AVEN_125077-1 [Araneus ventricosus]|uniref:Uncharacterized protein n=1 Tax=Araneus ventricosus TaxID=182803 RepID=A0A4Y2UK76_ARAVE|nr:hypothetical protein AVEN_125077-1 [Araneus ventricosus]
MPTAKLRHWVKEGASKPILRTSTANLRHRVEEGGLKSVLRLWPHIDKIRHCSWACNCICGLPRCGEPRAVGTALLFEFQRPQSTPRATRSLANLHAVGTRLIGYEEEILSRVPLKTKKNVPFELIACKKKSCVVCRQQTIPRFDLLSPGMRKQSSETRNSILFTRASSLFVCCSAPFSIPIRRVFIDREDHHQPPTKPDDVECAERKNRTTKRPNKCILSRSIPSYVSRQTVLD